MGLRSSATPAPSIPRQPPMTLDSRENALSGRATSAPRSPPAPGPPPRAGTSFCLCSPPSPLCSPAEVCSGEASSPSAPVMAPPAPGGGAGTAAPPTGGGTTLGFALLAAASAASWCAAVGTADPGLVAFAELGVDLGHLVLVPRPGPRWAQVAATLLDGMDVVLVRPPGPVRPGVARQLAARARERRGVLVVLGSRGWPEGADVQLTVEAGAWQGVEAGHGHLQGRHLEVLSSGRRAAARPVRVGLWLPAPSGRVVPGDSTPIKRDERAGKRRQTRAGKREVEAGDGTAARHLVPRHP